MKGIQWLLWLQARNQKFNGWLADSPYDYYIDGILAELDEVRTSLEKQDYDELELELGDVLWNVLSLIHKFDHAAMVNRDNICLRAVAKFAERMPYNVLWYFEGDADKREQIWNTVKEEQKIRGMNDQHPLVQSVWDHASWKSDG